MLDVQGWHAAGYLEWKIEPTVAPQYSYHVRTHRVMPGILPPSREKLGLNISDTFHAHEKHIQ
jgi:hypothetical protein